MLIPTFYGSAFSPQTYVGDRKYMLAFSQTLKLAGALAKIVPFGSIRLHIYEEILAGPLTSREFEKIFKEKTLRISALIKEVTLGSASTPLA